MCHPSNGAPSGHKTFGGMMPPGKKRRRATKTWLLGASSRGWNVSARWAGNTTHEWPLTLPGPTDRQSPARGWPIPSAFPGIKEHQFHGRLKGGTNPFPRIRNVRFNGAPSGHKTFGGIMSPGKKRRRATRRGLRAFHPGAGMFRPVGPGIQRMNGLCPSPVQRTARAQPGEGRSIGLPRGKGAPIPWPPEGRHESLPTHKERPIQWCPFRAQNIWWNHVPREETPARHSAWLAGVSSRGWALSARWAGPTGA
jgi:hypothetical protein